MIAYAGAIFIGITFIALIRIFGVLDKPLHVMAISAQAFRDFRDPTLQDDAKEALMRAQAKKLAWLFMVITAGLIAAVAVPVGLLWALDAVGVLSLNAVVEASLSPEVVLGGTMLIVAMLWISRVRPRGS